MDQTPPASTPTTPAPGSNNQAPTNQAITPKQTNTAKPQAEQLSPGAKPIQRRYKENTSFFSDLFKLKVAKMLQWKGWTKISRDAPFNDKGHLNDDWVETEHCHYFHTIDSNGKVQEHCQPVGQHVHKIKVVRDPNNPEDILEVRCDSGPLVWEITTKYGKRQRVLVPARFDDHRHETEYIKSNKLSRPDMNSEAVKVIGRAQSAESSTEVFDESGKPLGKLAVK